MKNKFLIVVILILISSCSSVYNTYDVNEDLILYKSKSLGSKKIIVIPKGEVVKVKGTKEYKKIKYKNYLGWGYKPKVSRIAFKIRKNKSSFHSTNSSFGTVTVKGYYRKDGTYVRSHTRGKPKAKKYKSYYRKRKYKKRRR
ncbi:hypothetical protein [Tenacibaculum halocynthiae]|uniref:hypothetical protein n=1 Tax=Tenacibaculum halocynthiae TaxID=1254437 RepID=UPI003D6530C7